MLSKAKKNPICHGKEPKAVAAAVLYACCLKKKEAYSSSWKHKCSDTKKETCRYSKTIPRC